MDNPGRRWEDSVHKATARHHPLHMDNPGTGRTATAHRTSNQHRTHPLHRQKWAHRHWAQQIPQPQPRCSPVLPPERLRLILLLRLLLLPLPLPLLDWKRNQSPSPSLKFLTLLLPRRWTQPMHAQTLAPAYTVPWNSNQPPPITALSPQGPARQAMNSAPQKDKQHRFSRSAKNHPKTAASSRDVDRSTTPAVTTVEVTTIKIILTRCMAASPYPAAHLQRGSGTHASSSSST